MKASGVSIATTYRDIAFINRHSKIFGGKLAWDSRLKTYYFQEIEKNKDDGCIGLEFLESHVLISHYGVSDEVWGVVRKAIIEGKRLSFSYHDVQKLEHRDSVELIPKMIMLKKDAWFLIGTDEKREWNMKFMFDPITF
jgi:hypothetical protein